MNCLVTGGVGRLGTELIKQLVSSGHKVKAFDLPMAKWEEISGIEGVEAVMGDINNVNLISKATINVDLIFHLAALLPPRSEFDRKTTMKVNVEGTRNIIKAQELNKELSIVFASSVSTYGITTLMEPPIREDCPQKSHNYYSDSKIEAERLIRASGIPYAILRIAPIAIADLVELPDTIPYKAGQRVEFVFIDDAAKAISEAANNSKVLGKTLNIAGGLSWQMTGAEYITRFYDALGVEVDAVFSEEHTALDWYDTSHSQFLDYQRTSFNDFLDELRVLAEELGLI